MEEIVKNMGFEPEVIGEYRAKMKALKKNYIPVEGEVTEECVHFYFLGVFEGKEVVYDAMLYTLRIHYESELYEMAEHMAAQHFPQFKKISYEEDENGNLETLDPLEEEIGLYMAEVILDMEEEGTVKVKEFVELDEHTDFGIGIDAALHVDEISPEIIRKFIDDFNKGILSLDTTLYTFQSEKVA